jgi:hypothetical protein
VSSQPTCKQRWAYHKNDRMSDIRKLWKAECEGKEEGIEDLGTFYEYGLSFDYVTPMTWHDQPEGFWRYQISCGGPQEEFRFYSSGPQYSPYRITFAFLDWGDGYERQLVGKDLELMINLWDDWEDCCLIEDVYNKAMEE